MLKLEAENESDDDRQKRLLAAAKLLADATAKMVEAAKVRRPIDYKANLVYICV